MTTGTQAGTGQRYLDLAYDAGLTDAMTTLHAETCPGVLPCGPTGYALVPVGVEAACTEVQLGGARHERRNCREEVVRILPLDGGSILALRCRSTGAGPDPGDRSGAVAGNGDAADEATRWWPVGLAWLRLGLSERLLTECTRYLADRTTGGAPILQQQMVKGMAADALVEQLAARAVLESVCDRSWQPEVVTDVHQQITTADQMILRMFGARGFCEQGPGTVAYASELLADVYVPRRPVPARAVGPGRSA